VRESHANDRSPAQAANEGTPLRSPGEHGVSQRAHRRGLSLRKTRSSEGVSHCVQYWLVVPTTNNVLVGGDTGLSLEGIVSWLSAPPQPEGVSAFS
jgi:hypothetical protein